MSRNYMENDGFIHMDFVTLDQSVYGSIVTSNLKSIKYSLFVQYSIMILVTNNDGSFSIVCKLECRTNLSAEMSGSSMKIIVLQFIE